VRAGQHERRDAGGEQQREGEEAEGRHRHGRCSGFGFRVRRKERMLWGLIWVEGKGKPPTSAFIMRRRRRRSFFY
jgi:hypothetical protein